MKTLSRVVMVCLFVLAFFVGQATIQAQVSTGTILGAVHDSSGAVVPGASVVARETETNQSRTATSGGDGDYRFDGLPVGSYEVTVKATGFETVVQSGLTLAVGQEATENFTLQVGSVSQTVSVTAEAANLVNTTESSLSSLVAPQTISDLPLNGRNYIALTLLQPGVTQSTISGSTTPGYSGTDFSANGAPFRSNTYMLDGTILNNMVNANGGSASGSTLGVDGIQEFRILTNGYPAEYGFSMGSQQVIVTKSGTNSFHGDAFEFLRNSSLDARNYFDLSPSRLGHRLPEFRRNQFGGALGGPIQKDKTFFFGVYEGLRSSAGLTNTTTTLAPGCHGAAGAVITPAACPQITANATIAPQMAPFVALYPLPNLPSITDGYGYVFQQNITENYAQIRVDHTFSNSDNMFGRYTMDKATIPFTQSFNNSYLSETSRNQFITLAENHIFSSNVLNSARISYSGSPIVETNPITNPLLNGTNPIYDMVPGLPPGTINPSIVTSLGTAGTGNWEIKSAIFSANDDLSYNRGKHAMKFGFMFNFQRDITAQQGFVRGNAALNGVTGLLTGALTSFGGVVGPSGLPPYSNVPAGPPNDEKVFDFDTMGFYAQDSWKISPRLTLNGGIRYEPTTTVTDIHGRSYALRNPATDTVFTQGPVFENPSHRNWGPRVGFAWDVFGNGKTSLRGGFGIYYDLSSVGTSLTLIAEDSPPYNNQFTLIGSSLTQPILTFPYPEPVAGPTFPYQNNGIDYHFGQPHLLSWNLTAERQLPGDIGLTVAYAGSRGIDMSQSSEQNPVIPTGVPSANGGTSCVAGSGPSTAVLLAGGGSQLDGSANSCYLANSPRWNPAFTGLFVSKSAGDSFYHSLEVNAVKRLTHGLQFQTSYTWGRVIDDGYGVGFVDIQRFFREPLSEASNRSVSDQNIEQALNINLIYHIPGIDPQKGVLSKFTNGWYVAPIASAYTGHPFSLLISGNRSADGQLQSVGTPPSAPDLVSGRNHYNVTHGVSSGCGSIAAGTPLHTAARWYDPCAFSIPPTGFIGTEPRDVLTGPGVVNLDFSIVKDTRVSKLGEGGAIQFRSEFFNLLNHTNFLSPAGFGLTQTFAAASCGGSALACSIGPQQPISSTAGVITATNGNARQIQFALKLIF